MQRTFVAAGTLFGLSGVALGALGAHALKDVLDPESLKTFEVAARYQMYHALALVSLGLGYFHRPSGAWNWAGRCLIIGTLLFSGSLYGLCFDGPKILGPITPLGGVFQILGWSLWAWGALRGSHRDSDKTAT